jgi:hypothetical protein
MAQELNAGEWIADGVLAALGEDLETLAQGKHVLPCCRFVPTLLPATKLSCQQKDNATSRHHADPYISHPMGFESLRPTQSTRPVSQQPIKTEITSPQATFTSTWGAPHVPDPPSGSRGVSNTYADPTARDDFRPMALTERPAASGFASGRDKSAALISDSLGRPFPQAGRSCPHDTSKLPAQGPFSCRINVHGTQALGEHRDSILEAAPSKPRAMLTPAPAKAENSRPTAGTEVKTIVNSLTRHDLEKWPCRRCLFVHRGGECETSCIGCGSRRHDKHDLICPFKNKLRQEDHAQVPVKKEYMPLNEPPSRLRPADPRVSSTMQLSLECQRRGFNPEFKYYRGRDEGDNRADLWIRDKLISGGGISYKSQKDARDALAPKGLEVVRKMGYGLVTGGLDAGRMMGGTSLRPVPSAGSTSVRSPPSVLRSSSRSQGFPARQSEKRAGLRETEDAVMDLIKSVQTPHWRERPADALISSAPTNTRRLGPSQQVVAKGSVTIKLPDNINPHSARDTIEKAVAANPQTNISLHFPANVSVEIAQAYGLAISAMATSSRRRSRSRSRSPVRGSEREYRDRDCDYRDRERDIYYSRSSVWPPRTMTDAYRPSPHAIPRKRVDDSRLRLSPPPEPKYQPLHERRDRHYRDGPAPR